MINKDLVKRQMEVGISYAEFSYMLMQGYDFKYLHDNYGVDMQFGGSDQWGNLTTGIELIRKLNGEEAYAFSVPLLTDSTGKKLGKSYGNALWIDREKTSPYELYQYLLNFEDVMVEEYIKKYTFLSKEEIETVMEEHNKAPEKRIAQRTIAEEVVRDLHGQEALEEAITISEALFSGNVKDLTDKQIEESLKTLEHFEVAKDEKLIDILPNTKITSSRRETRELLEAGAITINGEVAKDENMTLDEKRKYNIVRRGKKKYYILKQK
jgi:tyrosyl-tRNA synthetase